jgi:hypothetical protein
MYIAGSWVTTDETRSVINPADESVIAEAPQAQADHAEQALEAAQRAQRNWGRKSGVERGATLRAIAEGTELGRTSLPSSSWRSRARRLPRPAVRWVMRLRASSTTMPARARTGGQHVRP